MKPKSKILIIAGSDSSGGAGIQADIKTVTALGGYAMTAVTAITAQNTTGVKSVVPIPPKEIEKQILFTSKDIKPDAIKIGMLHSPIVINSVIKSLQKVKTKKIILDPVMVAKGGFKLINDTAIKVLKEKLIKKVYLITPNIPEAEVLTKTKIKNLEDMIRAANILLNSGVKNVLVKGGHRNSKIMKDVFLNNTQVLKQSAPDTNPDDSDFNFGAANVCSFEVSHIASTEKRLYPLCVSQKRKPALPFITCSSDLDDSVLVVDCP